MGTRARVGLLLGAASCLLAVMFDWIISLGNDRKPARVAAAITASPTHAPTAKSAVETSHTV